MEVGSAYQYRVLSMFAVAVAADEEYGKQAV
jgi:hypothetical protein